jgi:dihydrofolate synthase/folylpolyglutamate synthase
VIHVAGTNGKGSVCAKIAKTLEIAGHRVGLLISPHIASYRERISINGELISEAQVNTHLQSVVDLCTIHSIPATFFEITTGVAFSYFEERDVDVVVLETGLGGRLDATNVVTKPRLCVITSIGLEHTAILGDTVELIAAEKAGIIKKGVPILVGPNVPYQVVHKCAIEKNAERYCICEDLLGIDCFDSDDGTIYLDGKKYADYDVENSKIATAALKLVGIKQRESCFLQPISDDDIAKGTSHRPSCRFEVIKTNSTHVILDIAHNPPAMITLIAKLQATYPNMNKRIVVGFSADKEIGLCSKALLSLVKDPSRIHLVEAVNLRAAKIQSIIASDPKMEDTNFEVSDRSITAQVKYALQLTQNKNEILVVCGSVFLMAEAREALGIDEPRDSKLITSVAGVGLLKCKQRLLSEKK